MISVYFHNAWANFDIWVAVSLLAAYFVLDGMYAAYTIKVTEKRPATAATIGALMHFIIAFGVLSYVQNFLYVVPIAIGSWFGTYTMVHYEHSLAYPRNKTS
jgi:hypothetical protein